MGTWGTGPFDNDDAADWCGDLDDADASERPSLVIATLQNAATAADYLETPEASAAVAAAAVVAATLPGSERLTSPYAPTFLTEGGPLVLPPTTPAVAIAALDRVTGENSEWRELWEESAEAAEAVSVVASLRQRLAAAP